MSRATIIAYSDADRRRAASWALNAPKGCRIDFREAKRSLEQNARMWAMLTEISRQVKWHGIRLSADDWKLLFLDALSRELRIVPNMDGTGFVNLGRRSSELSRSEMSDMIELMFAFGASHDVNFKDGDGE
jgi:hypothetical protein